MNARWLIAVVVVAAALSVAPAMAQCYSGPYVSYYAPYTAYYAPPAPYVTYYAPYTSYYAPYTSYYAPYGGYYYAPYSAYYGPTVYGTPQVYVPGQPVRNVVRWVTPY
ncbi:MAG: hypothetical protein ABSG68_26340 [Thermoguttaceae bacterium]|jgi:hypothetical protein